MIEVAPVILDSLSLELANGSDGNLAFSTEISGTMVRSRITILQEMTPELRSFLIDIEFSDNFLASKLCAT
jgi:hypothetical protein